MKNHNASRDAESGGYVLWQMDTEMWYIEHAVGNSKIHSGCNGKIVWRHTPWIGAYAAKGSIHPLFRALHGLDLLTITSMFAAAHYIREKNVNGEDCFILKLCVDPRTLKERREGPAKIIRFGVVAMSHTKIKMEVAQTIEEVAFNVLGLSMDCFISPTDLKYSSINETCELSYMEREGFYSENSVKMSSNARLFISGLVCNPLTRDEGDFILLICQHGFLPLRLE